MDFSNWKKNRANAPVVERAVTEKVYLEGHPKLPIVYKALVPELDLATWYQLNAASIEQDLLDAGGILFRGFAVDSEAGFKSFSQVAFTKLAEYVQGATPRIELQKDVYTSTEFPADQEIELHNELSYVLQPPRKIAFCCLTAAREGGQTQIADVHEIYNKLDASIVEEFKRRGGWMLKRNYHYGFGPSVFSAFKLDSLEKIREYCAREQVEFNQVSEQHFMTRQVRDVVHSHPVTSKPLWMNHVAFWHPDNLLPDVRAKLSEMFSPEDFPYSTYYGDGTPIDSAVIAEISQLYRKVEVAFEWKAGDVMLLDNWRVAHGRKPFVGERKVIVSMGQ